MYGGGDAYQVHEYRDGTVGDCALGQCIIAGEHACQHHRGIKACPPGIGSRMPVEPCLGTRLVPTLRPARSKKNHSAAEGEDGHKR